MFDIGFEKVRVKTSGAEINVLHGGAGNPLLLLHGYPQTHVMWHRVAPDLRNHFHVICPDLRGYGDSSKPESRADHYPYSKRAMALDMIELMAFWGHRAFFIAGHDRGARVAHRMALDFPDKITRACVMDVVPTYHMFKNVDQNFAAGYYHWFFLIQPDGLPEHMIGVDSDFYLKEKLKRWSAPNTEFDPDAIAEYQRCFRDPHTIHATCEDYRAAATVDLIHDEESRQKKITCPLLVLWGKKGFVHRTYNVLDVWKQYAEDVEGKALNCGHFLAEEDPVTVAQELRRFFGGGDTANVLKTGEQKIPTQKASANTAEAAAGKAVVSKNKSKARPETEVGTETRTKTRVKAEPRARATDRPEPESVKKIVEYPVGRYECKRCGQGVIFSQAYRELPPCDNCGSREYLGHEPKITVIRPPPPKKYSAGMYQCTVCSTRVAVAEDTDKLSPCDFCGSLELKLL